MIVSALTRALEDIAPLAYAEDWDNVGLLAGDPEASVSRILLAIDCTRAVVDEAERVGAEMIVAYHPPIFRPMTRVTRGSIAYEAVRRNITVYSPHTALDAAPGGTNDVLADAVGMDPVERAPIRASVLADAHRKLVTFVPVDALENVSEALFAAGAGRIGNYRSCSFRSAGTGTFLGEAGTNPVVGTAGQLETAEEIRLEVVVPIARTADVVRALRASHPYEEPAFDLVHVALAPAKGPARGMGRIGAIAPVDRGVFLARVKENLGLGHALVAGPLTGEVSRVAVCAGSAGDLLDAAVDAGAEVIVTGEARHHDALGVAERGVTLICALHSNSERITLAPLAARLRASLPGLLVTLSRSDHDPFVIC